MRLSMCAFAISTPRIAALSADRIMHSNVHARHCVQKHGRGRQSILASSTLNCAMLTRTLHVLKGGLYGLSYSSYMRLPNDKIAWKMRECAILRRGRDRGVGQGREVRGRPVFVNA